MVKVLQFYMDDSGTRHPDRNPGRAPGHGYDWFGMGGVLVRQEQEPLVREAHARFLREWNIDGPLHSSEIRARAETFRWLHNHPEAERFYEELYQLMNSEPLLGIACVIDRPGYNARYHEKYGVQKWSLCKTAFAVAVDRAAKYARDEGYKLRVLVEKSDKKTDRRLKEYYDSLRVDGSPFDSGRSEQYGPLSAEEFRTTLYEFRTKAKTSPIMQLADLFLWPMCMGGYHASNRPYRRLIGDDRLIDCRCSEEELPVRGIKYSCFEGVERKN